MITTRPRHCSLVHHWWVATKAVITLVQLGVGIAILSPVLDELATGGTPASAAQVAGLVACVGALILGGVLRAID